ncbi:MAG: Crp/Fnr family transcriptional regulator [Hyphomonadaceae bacterium]|nr:Crp/Fnr family transcriptional regulator [Hyphomonadaceae bacterium]MBY0565257.1 Crp/Fnr family transcriptional regulator [Hyphomonadaceae bacterium]
MQRFPLFSTLDERALQAVFDKSHALSVSPTSSLQLRSRVDSLWLAWSGGYRVFFRSPAGANISLRLLRPGEHFGEVDVIIGKADTSYGIACDAAGVLLNIPGDSFRELLGSFAALRDNLLRALAWANVHSVDRLYTYATLDTRTRLLAEIVRLSVYSQPMKGAVHLTPAPTHDALANLIGATREVVTRHLRSLSREGLIQSRRGEMTVLDIDRLRQLVETKSGPLMSYRYAPSGDMGAI